MKCYVCWVGAWYGTTDDCWMCVVASLPAMVPERGGAGEDEEEEEEEEEDILRGAARAAGQAAGAGAGRGPGAGAGRGPGPAADKISFAQNSNLRFYSIYTFAISSRMTKVLIKN